MLVPLTAVTVWVCSTWTLGLVGDDTADEVRLSAAQVGHQLVQVLLDLHEANTMLSDQIPSNLAPGPVQLALCNCETVWNEAAFLFLILVSDFGSAAGKHNRVSLVVY